eukprot:CAMPEP_0184305762 /NCGR_PEP_ID=MMETSP1049-20130417/14951_1 /TAXON_ID=77928 /ORGANISM="Proteomonas sulcata, Strain CCMP704" /LENGTH=443 /DNA_ID=CAMNT_0026617895 /DNA_START=8 /DNA_END=1336 /DNA_ORIENTATION=+
MTLAAGDFLYRQLEIGTEMYFVVKGNLKCSSYTGGNPERISGGDFVGEFAVFEDMPNIRLSSVQAHTDCELLILRAEDFARVVIPLYPDLAQCIKDMAQFRMQSLEQHTTISDHIRSMSEGRCMPFLLRIEAHQATLRNIKFRNQGHVSTHNARMHASIMQEKHEREVNDESATNQGTYAATTSEEALASLQSLRSRQSVSSLKNTPMASSSDTGGGYGFFSGAEGIVNNEATDLVTWGKVCTMERRLELQDDRSAKLKSDLDSLHRKTSTIQDDIASIKTILEKVSGIKETRSPSAAASLASTDFSQKASSNSQLKFYGYFRHKVKAKFSQTMDDLRAHRNSNEANPGGYLSDSSEEGWRGRSSSEDNVAGSNGESSRKPQGQSFSRSFISRMPLSMSRKLRIEARASEVPARESLIPPPPQPLSSSSSQPLSPSASQPLSP